MLVCNLYLSSLQLEEIDHVLFEVCTFYEQRFVFFLNIECRISSFNACFLFLFYFSTSSSATATDSGVIAE